MVFRRRSLLAVAAAACAGLVAGECPNACSGHGTCGAYDMCTCYTGYIANDCSERTCPFANAHVDSPIGDLDADGTVSATTAAAGDQFSPNQAELFPLMENTAGTKTKDSAHYYAECANKGICDRSSGACTCFVGYEGSACQRASCPNNCGGHGICLTNRELAAVDYDNVYELWDADVQQGCYCDPGFTGYDCALRECVYGMDPLYLDDENTARVSTWTAIFTAASGDIQDATGTWRLKFYDVFGEDWVTQPIVINKNDTETYTDVQSALEALPFDVIASDTVSVTADLTARGSTTATLTLTMTFTGNPGPLRVPELVVTDEAGRDTTFDDSGDALTASLTDTGIVGEDYDNFGQNCGISVTVTNLASTFLTYGYVAYMAPTSTLASDLKILKACLGDSNDDTSDNVDIENWDWGSSNQTDYVPDQYPHLVKLVPVDAADEYDGGVYAIAFWDDDNTRIALATSVDTSIEYYVFATDGVLERVWYDQATLDNFDITDDDMGLARFEQYSNLLYTQHDFSCENQLSDATTAGVNSATPCLEKGDYIVIPSSQWGSAAASSITGFSITNTDMSWQDNTNTAGIYEIKKIAAYKYYPSNTTETEEDRYQITVDRPVFWDGSSTSTSVSTNLASTIATGLVQIFKWTPPDDDTDYRYQYVQECSGRGLCDRDAGTCSCFAGYTNDNCDTQSALAV